MISRRWLAETTFGGNFQNHPAVRAGATSRCEYLMSRYLVLVVIVLLGSSLGCRGVVGPFGPKLYDRADDPRLATSEQARRSRAMYAFPDRELGPSSGPEKLPIYAPPGR
jgi:hypothetical protein